MNTNPVAVSGVELSVLALLGLVPTILGIVLAYWLVRLAVRHGVRDALRSTPGALGTGAHPVATRPELAEGGRR